MGGERWNEEQEKSLGLIKSLIAVEGSGWALPDKKTVRDHRIEDRAHGKNLLLISYKEVAERAWWGLRKGDKK